MRITAYDLAGKILWQDEAVGKGRSGQVNLIGTFLTGTEEAGKTAYQAVFNAATGVINDFNDKPPRDLYSLVETEKIPTLTNQKNISNFDMFKEYYEKGQFQFKRKNFHQALRSFKQAESVDPGDLSTKFYVGVCLFYTAQRDKAVEKFRHVVKQGPNTQEAKDSAKWLDLLKEPLKIGTVVLGTGRGARDPVMMPDENLVNTTIRKSSMYEFVNLAELKPPVDVAQTKNLDQYLEMSAKNGAAIILYITITDRTSRIPIQHKSSGEIADEFSMRLDAKVFSTRKKQKRTEIVVTEGTSTLFYKRNQEEDAIKEQLLKRGTEKLILRLLENDIF
jgi:tetratricopeptide (TPR) repeat protein